MVFSNGSDADMNDSEPDQTIEISHDAAGSATALVDR